MSLFTEYYSTDVACMTLVHRFVLFHIAARSKLFATDITWERFFPCVRAQVFGETSFMFRGVVAVEARIWFLVELMSCETWFWCGSVCTEHVHPCELARVPSSSLYEQMFCHFEHTWKVFHHWIIRSDGYGNCFSHTLHSCFFCVAEEGRSTSKARFSCSSVSTS